jgi:hypothetical protein
MELPKNWNRNEKFYEVQIYTAAQWVKLKRFSSLISANQEMVNLGSRKPLRIAEITYKILMQKEPAPGGKE